MRLGPILAAAALATLVSACGQSQPAAPVGGDQAGSAAAPAPPMSDADKQAALAALPAPYKTADLANGESKFALCQACHTLPPGGANMTGPNLQGVIGAKAGEGHADFKFSDALKASNIVWTPDKLDAWLTKPSDLVPGTKMTFAGLSDPKDRTDVIAYLMVSTGYKPK
ncbi:cytochrome c family protein [Phenylobacterium sp.]|uniref:c-type cytochrome n=1 Tax=Phenylobacterium sp. TaxID=1871053 RepID=UPI0025FD0FFF|nr:cytochrome c family protein [Phenylobacterium sp.]